MACSASAASRKIAGALGPVDGLLGASANLMGEVTVAYERPDTRTAVVEALAAAGFPVVASRTVP